MTNRWSGLLATVLVVALLGGIAALRWPLLLDDPHVAFLQDEDSAPWILLDRQFDLMANFKMRSISLFRHEFDLTQEVSAARLRLRAFQRFSIWLNKEFDQHPPDFRNSSRQTNWKQASEIKLPGPLKPGRHVLYIFVENVGGPACLSAECRELGIRTDLNWKVL